METALRFVLLRVCAVYNSQSVVTAVANAEIHTREHWDMAVLSPGLSRRSLEPCLCCSRRGNVCGHVTLSRHLHVAPWSTRLLARSHTSIVGSCQILPTKEHQARSQFLDKKLPGSRLLMQRYHRHPCGALCVLTCMMGVLLFFCCYLVFSDFKMNTATNLVSVRNKLTPLSHTMASCKVFETSVLKSLEGYNLDCL